MYIGCYPLRDFNILLTLITDVFNILKFPRIPTIRENHLTQASKLI